MDTLLGEPEELVSVNLYSTLMLEKFPNSLSMLGILVFWVVAVLVGHEVCVLVVEGGIVVVVVVAVAVVTTAVALVVVVSDKLVVDCWTEVEVVLVCTVDETVLEAWVELDAPLVVGDERWLRLK